MDKPTAIIVDDMSSVRLMAANCLEDVGYKVVGEAENGKDGLSLFKDLSPDLVLLDLEMPVMDGVEALKEIVKLDKNANVIILTAIDHLDIVEDCIFAGAKDYIRKDRGLDEIRSRISAITSEGSDRSK